jgi:hypothetical protein
LRADVRVTLPENEKYINPAHFTPEAPPWDDDGIGALLGSSGHDWVPAGTR